MNKGVVAFVILIIIYFSLGLVGGILANGSFVFNVTRNDSGIMNIFEAIVVLLGTLYVSLSWLKAKNDKILHHAFFGLLTITVSLPILTYYLHLPSNDYARRAAIMYVPISVILWIWSTKIINKNARSSPGTANSLSN